MERKNQIMLHISPGKGKMEYMAIIQKDTLQTALLNRCQYDKFGEYIYEPII